QAAFSNSASFVQRLTRADALNQVCMLIHVGLTLFVLLVVLPGVGSFNNTVGIAGTLCTYQTFANAAETTVFPLATHAGYAGTIGVLELDAEVIENIAVLGSVTHLATAGSYALLWRATHSPVNHVNIVYVLLHNVIAGCPIEIQPVAHLPFHV